MKLSLKIARRYLISKKSTNVINIISRVAMLGIAVGTMALIIVLSVFNGFEQLVISLYNKFDPDIKIVVAEGKIFTPSGEMLDSLAGVPGVAVISHVLEESSLLKYRDRQYIATVKGVDENYNAVSDIESAIYRGNFLLQEKGNSFAILGAGVEAALGANVEASVIPIQVFMPKRGAKISVNPEAAFNRRNILPAGVFSIQQEFDLKYVLVPLEFIRELLEYEKQVSALEIKLSKGANVKRVVEAIEGVMGNNFKVKTRYEQNEFLYKVMKTEKWAVYAILTFILIIAAFNMIGSLTMLVIEKKKDVGILKAMGADKKLIQQIFLLEGVLMSVIGTGIGFAAAIVLTLLQKHFSLLRLQGSGSFVIDAYPVELQLFDFILVLLTVLVIGITASWIPSKRAAEQKWLFKGH